MNELLFVVLWTGNSKWTQLYLQLYHISLPLGKPVVPDEQMVTAGSFGPSTFTGVWVKLLRQYLSYELLLSYILYWASSTGSLRESLWLNFRLVHFDQHCHRKWKFSLHFSVLLFNGSRLRITNYTALNIAKY